MTESKNPANIKSSAQAPHSSILLTPGPVQLHPKVLQSLALPMIHHRTPEFDQILKKVLRQLKWVFQTKEDCFLLSATGSGGMEALFVNLLSPGEKVIGIDSGKFGERWCEMATTFGAQLVRYKVPWGESAKPEELESLMKANPDTRVVFTQACETSTGAKHPVQALAQVVKKFPDVLFLVDAITALGAYELKMDEWGLDAVVGGSQKAFMLPTGMTLFSFSQKAWKKIESNPQPRFYFDVRKEKKANQSGETFFSSNVLLIRALSVVLDLIEEKGLEALFQEIAGRARKTRQIGEALGMPVFAEHPAESVTALKVPAGIDGQSLRAMLEKDFFVTIMGGQDQAKGKIIRIGNMGYIQDEEIAYLGDSLKKALDKMHAKSPA